MESGMAGVMGEQGWPTGGGEMGALIRAHDWSRSPLGPPNAWSADLRATVSLMLPAEAEIVLFWGAEYCALYNDAYAPTIGDKHPHALGRPAREHWAELWDDLGPLLDRVRETGRTLSAKDRPFQIARHGYLEEVFFDISYSPVRDDEGAVGGILCIVAETTARVRAEAALREAEARQAYLLALSDALRPLSDPAAIQQTAAAALGAQLGASRVAYFEVQGADYCVEHDFVAGVASMRGRYPAASFGPQLLGTYRSGQPVVVVDVAADPELGPDELAAFAAIQVAGFVVVPLIKDGGFVAGLTAQTVAPRAWTPAEVDLIAETAERTWAAVERARAEAERDRLLASERAARAEAEEAVRMRDTFLSIATHELRTPLTTLKGTVQLLQRQRARGQDDSARVDRSLATLDLTAERLGVLLDDLLDVARLRGDRLPLLARPADLATLVAESVAAARERADGSHDVTLVIRDNLPTFSFDAARIGQVLTNLLDNALKYSPDGGAVATTLRREGDGAVVAVRDAGIGLPPDAAEAIFAPFGRAANASASRLPGMGLGLFICRGIIEQHGGWIRAASDGEGRGTTVTFWLPLAGPPTEADGGVAPS